MDNGIEPDAVRASEVNRELTALLAAAGERMGFEVFTEYRLPGARLDVVWAWSAPTSMPGVEEPLPVVAFEIESSWRTRKHVKGDLLNLQDAAVSLGVIVLAGADIRDDALRRFALELVDRPGCRIRIWTDADVRSLAAGDTATTALAEAAAEVATIAPSALVVTPGREHTGKYRPLWQWLVTQERRETRLSLQKLEAAAGVALPESCRVHAAHWHSYEGSAVVRAIVDAGWHAHHFNREKQTIVLSPGPPPRTAS